MLQCFLCCLATDQLSGGAGRVSPLAFTLDLCVSCSNFWDGFWRFPSSTSTRCADRGGPSRFGEILFGEPSNILSNKISLEKSRPARTAPSLNEPGVRREHVLERRCTASTLHIFLTGEHTASQFTTNTFPRCFPAPCPDKKLRNRRSWFERSPTVAGFPFSSTGNSLTDWCLHANQERFGLEPLARFPPHYTSAKLLTATRSTGTAAT